MISVVTGIPKSHVYVIRDRESTEEKIEEKKKEQSVDSAAPLKRNLKRHEFR